MKQLILFLMILPASAAVAPAMDINPAASFDSRYQLAQAAQHGYQNCPKCNSLNLREAKYCHNCGYALDAGAAGQQAYQVATAGYPKNPALSFVLSFFVLPGLGQYYNGEPLKGTVQLLGTAGGLVLALTNIPHDDSYSYYYYDAYQDDYYQSHSYHKKGNTTLFVMGLITAGAFKLWSCIDAPLSSSRINRQRGYTITNRPRLLLGLRPGAGNGSPQLVMGVGKSF